MKLKNLLYRLSWKIGKPFHSALVNTYLYIKNFKGRERTVSYGNKNPDKKFYVIRKKPGMGEGLLSVFTYVMGRIDYADRNGYIPVVRIDEKGANPSLFDRYFVQKHEVSDEELYESKYVRLSGWNSKPVYPGWCNWINLNFNEQKKALFDKHITISQDILELADREAEFVKPEQCLGLYLRGTDYISLRPYGHPIQPTLADVKQNIDEILQKKGLSRIFLVTEDEKIYQQVAQAYPGMVITVREDRLWGEYDNKRLIYETIEKHGSIEDNNILYLVKTILLSKCCAFVGGRTNGSVVANALNGGQYEERFVYDVGLYS